MSHESGGAAQLYADPKVLVAAAYELMQFLRASARALASVPPGGFLQPPQGSHFETR